MCPTLCDPIDGSPPGSLVPGILQARTLEWVAISFSNAWKWKLKVKSLSRVQPLATPWTAAYHVSPSMGVSRQEYWSGLPFPSPSKLGCFLTPSFDIPSCYNAFFYCCYLSLFCFQYIEEIYLHVLIYSCVYSTYFYITKIYQHSQRLINTFFKITPKFLHFS